MIRATLIALALLVVAGAAVAMPSGHDERRPQVALAGAPGGLLHSNSRDGQAVLTAADMQPGDRRSGDVTIRNEGGAGEIVLATHSEGALAERLRLTVVDARSGMVVVEGPLTDLPDCAPAGALPAGAARTFRFAVTFERGVDDAAYMGANARADFEWRDRCGAEPKPEAAEPQPDASQPSLGSQPAPVGPGAGAAGGGAAPASVRGTLMLGDTRLAVGRGPYRFRGRSGTANVKVRCLGAASGTCVGRLELERREPRRGRGIAMAVGTFRIAAGKARAITLKLNARARRRVKSSRAVPVRAYVTATDSQGRRHRAAYRDTLRYSRR